MDQDEEVVQVSFFTKDPKIRVTDTPIAVPVRLSRFGLSEIINHLLSGIDDDEDDDDEDDNNENDLKSKTRKSRPFDFLINNEFLRTSLKRHLETRNLTTESIHKIEYVEALPAPEPITSFEHDDWVCAVDASRKDLFLSASYDCHIRIWNSISGKCEIDIANAHNGIVKDVRWRNKTTEDNQNMNQVISVGDDHVVKVWQLEMNKKKSKLICTMEGHTAGIDTLMIDPTKDHAVTGSWDSDVRLWDLTAVDEIDSESTKKRKVDNENSSTTPAKAVQGCIGVMQGHRGRVSSVDFPLTDRVYSVGWDCTLRTFDVNTLRNINTLTGPRPINTLSYSLPTGLIATGDDDKIIRIWDPRTQGSIIQKAFGSHTAWVSALRWHPISANLLLSASHDNSLKVWDIRSTIPLFTIAAHDDKVLCADWHTPEIFVSGGADKQLKVHGAKSDSFAERGAANDVEIKSKSLNAGKSTKKQ